MRETVRASVNPHQSLYPPLTLCLCLPLPYDYVCALGVDTVVLPPSGLVSWGLAIVRRLDFDADLRRMAVIVQLLHVRRFEHLDSRI